jgi:hypothetical protein
MHSKAALAALRDMAYHIDLAVHFTEGFTDEKFRADLRLHEIRKLRNSFPFR